ncbi:glutamate-1-semialdehyde 2,1-aminomutase [Hominifimenecus sp. rT4P-3]|uniref:glutamate-1-semialdehyde 2,1-aminomutase n=1 Tax=Hominifimenecus sp. rT4P-3 TaxID=3242979 RepID=UPI003DA45A56
MSTERSERFFQEAQNYIPGGVNSPVRAFQSIGSVPRFIRSADGARMIDEDGNEYIDYVCSWGPMILGHNYPAIRESVVEAASRGLSYGAATEIEVRMAKLICEMVPSIEMVRMVNSGTEAVMSAIRAARGFTGRDKIVKFNGCYHGHSDGLLVKAGSGVMTAGVPDSSGVPAGCTRDTLTADYNDLDSVKELFQRWGGQIAAVIVEPVGANMGVVLPEEGFLPGLRKLCDEQGSLLIFDEVITGFRLQADGAQGYFGVRPDLTTFGKIIGAGMPVGAYGGRRDVMSVISPLGAVYQAGTLSGNPVAMAAGYTQLTLLKEHPEWYRELNERAGRLFDGIRRILQQYEVPAVLNTVGSLGCVFFTPEAVTDYTTAKKADTKAFAAYANYLFSHGLYVAPSQFEAMFVSMAHGEEEVEQTLAVIERYLKQR